MKLSILVMFLSVNFCAFAQLKPIYFRGNMVISDSTQATSYGVYGKLSGEELYVLKTFDLENNLKITGTYKDDSLKIAHGSFVYYEDVDVFNRINGTNFSLKDKTRFISGKGAFKDGFQNGRWINFYPNGAIHTVVTYVMGVKHGFFGVYNKNGKTIISGAYKVDKKDGEWISGKVKQIYDDGVLQPSPSKKSKNKSN